jgi:hypothetical protein
MLLSKTLNTTPLLLLLLPKLSAVNAAHVDHTMAGAVPIGYLFEPAGQRTPGKKQGKESVQANGGEAYAQLQRQSDDYRAGQLRISNSSLCKATARCHKTNVLLLPSCYAKGCLTS